MLERMFSEETLAEAWQIMVTQFPLAIWETVYVTILATAFAIVLGLPLGVLLVVGEKDGILPLPKWLMKILNVVINLLRSVPFLILMILVFPLTRLIVGTVVGTAASVVPLVIAAFPFVARLAESSLREVNPNVIEKEPLRPAGQAGKAHRRHSQGEDAGLCAELIRRIPHETSNHPRACHHRQSGSRLRCLRLRSGALHRCHL